MFILEGRHLVARHHGHGNGGRRAPYMEFPPSSRTTFRSCLIASVHRRVALTLGPLLQALFLITTKGIPPLKDARKWTTLFRDFVGRVPREGCRQPHRVDRAAQAPIPEDGMRAAGDCHTRREGALPS